jgi:hypothetical protein
MLKPGDHLCLNRDGKVFLTQYTAVSAFVSISRTLGPDPEADVADMQATLDRMFHDQVRRNLLTVSKAAEAVGEEDGDQATRLLHYLDSKMRDEQAQEEGGAVQTGAAGKHPQGGPARKKRTPG